MGLTRISATSVTDTDFKTSCKVATSTNISSFTATPNSIDGYNFSVGDRVLVKAQDNPAQNGIYVVESVGTGSNGRWARAGDFRDAKGITNGAITFVERGAEANTFFFLGGLTSSVSIGSTALTFNSLVTETATTVIGSSQPNITSVGTLVTLDVTGNATVGNILANGFYFSNGSPFTVDSTQILNGNSNVKVAANSDISISVAGNSNVVVITSTGANISGTANITGDTSIGGNLTVTGDFTVNGTTTTLNTATLDVEDLNITLAKGAASSAAANGAGITIDGASVSFVYNSTTNTWVSSHGANINGTANITGNANVGNLGATSVVATDLTGNLTTAAQPNITSVGTLTSLTVTGNASAGNLNTAGKVVGSVLESNVATGTAPFTVVSTTQVANLNAATAGHAVTSNTVVDNSQPNITSVGTLTSLNVSGNANTGNLGTAQILASANITTPQLISNIATGTAPLVVTSTTRVSNLNVANAGYADTAGSATSATTAGTVTTAAQPNITSLGTLTSLGVSGTVTASTLTSNVATGTAPLTVTSTTRVSNLNVANAGYADTAGTATSATSATTAGTVTTAAQPNITSVGTLSALTVTGNANVGNILAGGFYYSNGSPFTVDSTQVVNGNSNVKVAANSNVTVSVAGNANVMTITGTGANISGTANITGNITAGNVSAAGFYYANGTPYNRYTASSSAPSSPTNGDLWYDSNDNVLYVRIGDGVFSAWLDISSSTDVFANITANNANITDSLTVGGNSNVTNITANGNITANYFLGNGSQLTDVVAASASSAATVTDNSQPNITSVGTLSSVTVTGNANVGNLNTTGDIQIGSNDIRSSTGNVAITLNDRDVTIIGNLAVQGLTTTIGSQNYSVQDSIIDLHTFSNLAPLTADDGRDIGIRMHYFKSTTDKHAFLGWANDTGALEYYSDATETSGVISGQYGTIKANLYLSEVATGTAPFTVKSTTQVANLNVAFAGNAVNLDNGTSNVVVTNNGNVTVGVAGNAAILTITGTGANISGTANITGNANVGNIGATFANITSNLAAGNLRTTGTLLAQSIIANANANVGNLNSSNAVTASTLQSNVATGTAPLTVSSTTQVANLNAEVAGSLVNGNSNVTITANSNVSVFVNGNATARAVFTSTGANIAGTANVTGNLSVGGILTDNYYYANGSPFSGGGGGGTFTASATAPTSPSPGDHWYDTDTEIVYLRVNDGTSDLWLDISTDLTARLTASGTTPASASLGDIWYDTTTDIIFQYINDGASNVWVDISSTGNTFNTITAITANLTTINSSLIQNGNSNVAITSNSNVDISVTGAVRATFTSTGIMSAGNITPTANATYSLGNTTNRWNNVWGVASSALYADLAEKYQADENYEPGTVVIFGGSTEITVTDLTHDTRVAGVISTNPAYLMNDGEKLGNWLPVALTGRVPCKVKGPVKKGDVVVTSYIKGSAEKLDKSKYEPGCIIGKALEDHLTDSIEIIEVVVGRF